MTGAPVTPAPESVGRGFPLRTLLLVLCGILLVLGGLVAATPFALRTRQGLDLVESIADGLPAGRLGRLEVQGLAGNPLGAFTVRRLAIRDGEGVWLEASGLALDWSPLALSGLEVQIDGASAQQVRILRRPVLGPPQAPRPLPVTVTLSRLDATVEMEPAFSVRRGLFRLTGALQARRGEGGGYSAHLEADSLLRQGDHLDLELDLGDDRPLKVRAEALEAGGGALAGAAGLPVDRPFSLSLAADGKAEEGKVLADLRSGDLRPVKLEGGWRPEGGEIAGLVDLSASSLTRPVADRLGALLRVSGKARGSAGKRGRYDIDLDLVTDAARAELRGPVDFDQRRTGREGVGVTATAPSLGRILGGVEAGAARITGRVSGDPGDWALKGQARVEKAGLAGYVLGALEGPFEVAVAEGRLDLDARIRGAGGRGQGLVFALLGQAPSLDLKAARLADGELLLEDVKAAGAGLRATGSGSRGLLGGLSFSGKAEVSRLDAGLPGASGRLNARWSARLARPQAPWEVTVSASGDRFASGVAELDRLLGGRPQLDARLSLRDADLRFERLDLKGAALQVQAPGARLAGDRIDAPFTWSASGPFAAGPVEIAGKASGSGKLGGRLAAPDLGLVASFDAINLPGLSLAAARVDLNWSPAGGSAQVRAGSPYGPASARTRFAFPEGGVRLSDIQVDAGGLRAAGEAALGARGASQADLTVELGPGAFLAEGRVNGSVRLLDRRGQGPWVEADLTARNALLPGEGLSVTEGRLTAEGPLSRLPFRLDARGQTTAGDWRLDGGGVAVQQPGGLRIDFDGGGEAAGRRVRTKETAVLELAGEERRARLRLSLGQGGDAALDLALGPTQARVTGRLEDVPASFLNPDLAGRLDARFDIQGQGARLVGQGEGSLQDVRASDSDPSLGVSGRFRAGLAGERLSLQADLSNAQGMRAEGTVGVPVTTRLDGFRIAPDRQGPLSGRVTATGEIRPLWDLFVGGEQSLSGRVDLRGDLSGTIAAPRAAGTADIEDGAFSDAATGLVLKNVIVRSRLSETAIQIDRATGADGQGGVLSGSGVISLQEGAASSFRLDLLNFRVIDNELATATASGQASMTRAADGRVTLKGGLTINRADVTAAAPTPTGVTPLAVTEINRPVEVGRRASRQGVGPAVALDVTLKAPQQVYIRGQGLDLEMSVDARVSGTSSRPRLTGLARVVRGSYAFADKRFEIDPSGVVYLSEDPARIRLDLAAVRSDPDLTAIVRIRGTAARPEISLTSTPPLPTDEIFSRILFGRSASQLSPLETAQLASAVASMAGGGALDVIGNLRGLAGLDRLTFAGGADGEGVEVSGGKYLTDNVLLIVTGGGRDGGSAQVEWNVSRSLSLISKLSGQGGNTLSVRWRRDY